MADVRKLIHLYGNFSIQLEKILAIGYKPVSFTMSFTFNPFVFLLLYLRRASSIFFLGCEGRPMCLPLDFALSLSSDVRSTIISKVTKDIAML
ncbi:hypothetical protein ABIE66_005990 [Peribacillus sp. B2I2]